ncbi:hypothetical protein E4U41_007364 [Claviceps citrina]|nr:hypothetical protein E4U41_007364 [Claviceps citrina]
MTSFSRPSSVAVQPRSSRSQQKVSVNLVEGDQENGRRFQLQINECVETKTVTTTTRLTRKFPRVFLRDPAPLETLDRKEYPLAFEPTPIELLEFSSEELDKERSNDGQAFDEENRVDQLLNQNVEKEDAESQLETLATGTLTPTAGKVKPGLHESPILSRSSRFTRHPYNPYLRPTRIKRPGVVEVPDGPLCQLPLACLPQSKSFPRPGEVSSIVPVFSNKPRGSVNLGTSTSAGPAASGDASANDTPVLSHREIRERLFRGKSGCLATPDNSELIGSSQRNRFSQTDHLRASPDPSQALTGNCDAASPAGSDSPTVFSSNVATPPITDADPEPFGDVDVSLQNSLRAAAHHRPTIDVVAAQDASLPSPRLSPTLAASQLHTADSDGGAQSSFRTSSSENAFASFWPDEPRFRYHDSKQWHSKQGAQAPGERRALEQSPSGDGGRFASEAQQLIDAFGSLRSEMKSYMMYQFMRHCPRPTLRVVANAVDPVFRCDFLKRLPLELGYHVLLYLDHRDLCRAAQVSKSWRSIVDGNETGWKELFDRDGYRMAPGELRKAIVQGWGWQDPVGALGCERDLSMQGRLTASEYELTRALRDDMAPKSFRTSKRKRALNAYTASERLKRRAGPSQEPTVPSGQQDSSKTHFEVKQQKSEGPLSAASAAAAAVPDPQLGLPSLRQLHLFKSIYRRHHMIRKSWTSGEVKPCHVAFAAHPRHVITCLQFDDDKIITGSDDTLIHIHDIKTGKLRKKLQGHEGGVWALQYEGNILVSGSTDRSVRVWDIERGLCQQVFYGHASTVRCLQILMPTETGRDSSGRPIVRPEKPLIITGSRDSQLRVWRLPEVGSRRYIQTGPPAQESDCPYFIRVLTGHTHSVRAISAHGDMLVSGSYDNTVRVWKISTGEALFVLRGHTQKVYSVVLDHKDNRCISGSMDSLVKIWDLATGACLHTLEGHTLLVGLLDLKDGRLVSAAADSTLRVWNPDNGRCRSTLMAHTGAITCFQHDGQKVISGSEKSVKMWDVTNGECLQDLLRDLTGVWQVKFDDRRCVAAVQRDQSTFIEILDFGAIRDGYPAEELGKRILLNEHEVREVIEDAAV